MAKYTKEQLRKIFQSKYDRGAFTAIIKDIMGSHNVRTSNERFTEPGEKETGYYIGYLDTPDSYHIGLFYYEINSGSVAHKKVGLRNLVKRFINKNWGEFDAAIVVFNDGTDWRLSFVCDIKEEATTPKRFTYVFGEKDNFYRTAIERFDILQMQEPTFENIRKAFSVDALSDDFFDTYRTLYADFVQYITGKRYIKEGGKWVEKMIDEKPNYQLFSTFDGDEKLVRDYVKKMFGRIVFLYFLQRKGWLDGNRQYMHDLFYNSDKKDDFLDGVLEPLFFEVLNTDIPYRTSEAKTLPGSENIPYLNGGLFAKDDVDPKTCIFPAEYFRKLFDFLDSYNFTIDENDADDAEIGIDPEMLGRIFENLLEDNKDKGAFYTPKEIVDYMCRESLIAYLLNDNILVDEQEIRSLVENIDGERLSLEQRKFIKDRLKAVKICDPAIGSGAFPMGLVNLLSKIYQALRLTTDIAFIKRHIMEQNIYGVDIEKGAVDIARLRFWLAMIVEEKDPIPLPNLHFKIMQGNSLLESYNGIDLSDLTKVSGQSSLFDSANTEREALVASLKSYYKTSDHQERDRLFNTIINNVRRQLYDKCIILPSGEDPSANMDFFLWHTWFTDVFENGGFDIVIGNPPYISALEAKKILGDFIRNQYKANYLTAKGAYDMYIIFFELAVNILTKNGILSFITPSKYLSAEYASALREFFIENINVISLGDFSKIKVFENAGVSSIVSIFSKGVQQKEIIYKSFCSPSLIERESKINAHLLTFFPDNMWGFMLNKNIDIFLKIIKNCVELSKYAEINACTTAGEAAEYEAALNTYDKESFCFINNGTLRKYHHLWGIKEVKCAHLLNPYLPKKVISKRRETMYALPKLIFAKIGRTPQCFFDEKGMFASANTNMVYNLREYDYHALQAYFNSSFFDYVYRTLFGGIVMLGSIQVQAPQLRKSLIPNPNSPLLGELANLSREISSRKEADCYSNTTHLETLVEITICKIFELSFEEVKLILPNLSCTEKEYDQVNVPNSARKADG